MHVKGPLPLKGNMQGTQLLKRPLPGKIYINQISYKRTSKSGKI